MPIAPPPIAPIDETAPSLHVQFFRKGTYQIEQHRDACNVLAPAQYWLPYSAQVNITGPQGQMLPLACQIMIALPAQTVDDAFKAIPEAITTQAPVLLEAEARRQINQMREQARNQSPIVRAPGI